MKENVKFWFDRVL